uniref:Serine protease inhibitor n=1 Tax=Haemaphysalis longicornis TaxID=44386 RepID=B6F0V3_HAELO|nr:serine protease inhibitor [Haemaphysalis longicornis]
MQAACFLILLCVPLLVYTREPFRQPSFCGFPADPGRCRASMPRWFYNNTSGHCEPFIYGGCQGNKNRFHSCWTCQRTCLVKNLHKRIHRKKNGTHGKWRPRLCPRRNTTRPHRVLHNNME